MAKAKPRRDPGLRRAFKVKTITELAKELGIEPASVSGWRRIPAERVSEVSRITGVPRAELRPDIFGESA